MGNGKKKNEQRSNLLDMSEDIHAPSYGSKILEIFRHTDIVLYSPFSIALPYQQYGNARLPKMIRVLSGNGHT